MSSITLREVQKLVAQCLREQPEGRTHILSANTSYVRVRSWDNDTASYRRIYLPEFRNPDSVKYHEEQGYIRVLDRMISKYGLDAEFEWDPSYETENGNKTTKPITEGDNDDQQSKGVGSGPCGSDSDDNREDTNRKPSEPRELSGSCSSSGRFGASESMAVPGGNSGNFVNEPGGVGLPSPNRVKANREFGAFASEDNLKTTGIDGVGKQAGLGTQPDGKEEDALHPAQTLNPSSLKNLPNLEANEVTDLSQPFAEWGIHPHPTYSTSFTSFKGTGSYALPSLNGSKFNYSGSSSYTKENAKIEVEQAAIASFESINGDSGFGNGNPGGFLDTAEAKLRGKRERGQARAIREEIEMFFRLTDVGIGQGETPRLNSSKLARELVSKSVRMARTKREERGVGLKLILVDVSPSCSSIRDACAAAAYAIADNDPDVVVLLHFNGYVWDDDTVMVGQRYKEVPIITESEFDNGLEEFEAFLSTGKLSGCIAFGDGDAAKLYGLIAKYAPTVWLTPYDESDCKMAVDSWSSGEYCFDKAHLYVVPYVTDALSAIRGLRSLKMAEQVSG